MQVQSINNQQPNFGKVKILKVDKSPVLSALYTSSIFWSGMKNAPFKINIPKVPNEKGIYDVVVFTKKDSRQLQKAELKMKKAENGYNVDAPSNAQKAKTYAKLVEARIKYEQLTKSLKSKAETLIVKKIEDLKAIPDLEGLI